MTNAEIKWFEVPEAAELWEGDFVGTDVGGEHVLLVRHLGGELRAFQGMCPHQEQLLDDAGWDEETGVLICSGHMWEFDLKSGVGVNPAGCVLYEYVVRCSGDTVEIGIPQDGLSHYNRCPGT